MKYSESNTVELKRLLDDDMKAEVVAFLNSHLGGTIYAILMLCNAAPSMSFPLGLKIDILNAGLTLLILGCIFILYPIS